MHPLSDKRANRYIKEDFISGNPNVSGETPLTFHAFMAHEMKPYPKGRWKADAKYREPYRTITVARAYDCDGSLAFSVMFDEPIS